MRPSRPARPLLLLAAIASASLASPAWALAEGWTQFQGGAGHSGASAEGPDAPYRLAWSAPVPPGGPGDRYGLSSPVITDGLAIAVGPQEVVAVDLASGAPVWSVPRDLGPSVTPALARSGGGEVVLFTDGWGDGPTTAGGTATPTTSGSASPTPSPSVGGSAAAAPGAAHLVAVGLGDQKERWRVDLTGVSRTGVTVAGQTAIVGTNDGTVTAVDVATGEVAWTAEAGGLLETPIAATDTLALVPVRGTRESGTRVLALRLADGEEEWRYSPVTASAVLGPVSIGPGDVAFVAPADATVRAFSLADGVERWIARLNSFVPTQTPVPADGDVFVADVRSQVYRLDGATGERVWDHAANAETFRTNLVVSGQTLVLGTTSGELLSFDLGTGDLRGRLVTTGSPIRGLAVGAVLVAVRAGNDAGIQGFAQDASGSLLQEKSPTVLDAGRMGLGWLGAAAVVVVVAGLLGRVLATRVAPFDLAELPEADEGEDP